MPNEPPDDLVCHTYPYAFGYCLGRISRLVDESERIAIDSQTMSKPVELRERISNLHSLVLATHNELNSIKVHD